MTWKPMLSRWPYSLKVFANFPILNSVGCKGEEICILVIFLKNQLWSNWFHCSSHIVRGIICRFSPDATSWLVRKCLHNPSKGNELFVSFFYWIKILQIRTAYYPTHNPLHYSTRTMSLQDTATATLALTQRMHNWTRSNIKLQEYT